MVKIWNDIRHNQMYGFIKFHINRDLETEKIIMIKNMFLMLNIKCRKTKIEELKHSCAS